MPSPLFSDLLIWTLSLAGVLCMLLRPRRIAEAWWVCGAALLLIATRLIPLKNAGQAAWKGLDVYLFLTGMMILAELAREEGVFDWVAGWAAQHADHSPQRLFLLVYGVGTIVTALLSNDATAVVLTPAVLAVVRRARVEPKPHLLACAFIANAASFVLPISNPANLVVFDNHIPPLGNWLSIFAVPSIASIALTYVCLRLISHTDLRGTIDDNSEPHPLSPEGKFALAGLLFAAAALIASSAFGLSLGAPTCTVAVLAMLLVAWRDHGIIPRVVKGVSWSVLPLVAGLFIIVAALESTGLLKACLAGLLALAHLPALASNLIAAFAVALASNGMNNLPVGLISAAAIQTGHESGILAHAILIGVDLGPNLSVTGSLATILWLIALRRENVHISAWRFLKVGLLAMPLALIASVLLLTS